MLYKALKSYFVILHKTIDIKQVTQLVHFLNLSYRSATGRVFMKQNLLFKRIYLKRGILLFVLKIKLLTNIFNLCNIIFVPLKLIEYNQHFSSMRILMRENRIIYYTHYLQ